MMSLLKPSRKSFPTPIKKKSATWPESLLDGSEMSERIYREDWSKTPLGPIREWQQSLRTLVSMAVANSFPMLVDWGPDKIQIYNDAFISIAGHNHPKMLGRPCREIWAEIWDDIINPIFIKVCETNKAVYVDTQHFPMMRFGYLEEVYCLTAYSPLQDDNGDLGGILLTVTETTGKVLGERRLKLLRDLGARSSEARSVEEACQIAAETFEHSGADIPFALFYLTDKTGKSARRVAAVGIQPDLPASPSVLNMLQTDDGTHWPLDKALHFEPQRVDDIQDRFGLLPGGPWPEHPRTALILPIAAQTLEYPLGFLVCGVSARRPLDDQYWEFLTLVGGQVATAIANAQVYEQEKKRSDALAELDRQKTVFFSNVSHEFRTPLTLMLGPLEEMLSHTEHFLPEDLQHLNILYRNGLRLLRLVNSLLDFSRIEAGRIQARYQATDLSAFTADLASVFRSAMEKAGLSFTVDCPPLPEPFYIDREMWEKIVLNLLSNAFKFTFTGGVTLQLAMQGDHAILSVRDTGAGIPVAEREKIFERFHRIKESRSRTHEGSGIGLALVKELVKLHSGTISVDSTLEQGSTFTVTIPRGFSHLPADKVSSGTEPAMEVLKPSPGSSAFVEEALRWLPEVPQPVSEYRNPMAVFPEEESMGEKPLILLVDDNADMLAYVKRLLLPTYEVMTASDGDVAWRAIQEASVSPALVLTDVMMPVMDGFELLHRLRETPATRTVPVIMLSARAGEEASIEGLEAGADDYLVKPFSAQELLARVRSNLEMARIRREAEEAMFQAQKMQVIGQLAGGVAHDFNSLLTVLVGNLSLLETHVEEEDATGRRMLKSVFEATERISSLTKQLLAFARKQPLSPESVDLNELIYRMDELFKRTLGGMIQVKQVLSEDLWATKVDVHQMELAILNLAINARDAMPKGGILTLNTQNVSLSSSCDELAAGDYVQLSVSDTGVGMAPKVLAKAFEPFFTTKEVGEGTGLGLSQVYGLAKQLGGVARIHSTLGQGTTVEILLPRDEG